MARSAPDISVVLTLLDHNGHGVECVESWARRQDLGRDRYEVIVVGSGGETEVEARVRPLLGAEDHLLRLESPREPDLHDHGARAARGRWLLFTEAHCIAEPSCLTSLLGFLSDGGSAYVGAAIRSFAGPTADVIARCERRWYDDGFKEWSREGDWRKVTIRGFAIRRDVYLEVGGFEYRFGCFAETALAATLDSRELRLGYTPDAAVEHYDATEMAELMRYIREYRQRELAYRATRPRDYCERYFGVWPPPEGRRGRLATWLRFLRARARFSRPGLDDDERYRRFRELWMAASDHEQQRALARA